MFKKLKPFTNLSVLTLVVSILIPLAPTHALSSSDFQAGRIIDDSIFFDSNSMGTSTIQSFLNSKVPTCDTWHTGRDGHNPPFTCLKDYSQDTPIRAAEAGLCNQYPGGTKSAAQIIYDVSQVCGINPKVLIILLEKEQSLVTDSWPWDTQYRSATGFGCPDTAPCDAQYYGFFNQVYTAARQYKKYSRDESTYRYRKGRDNFIQYNPNSACNGTNVFIQNQATAGLYNYTPYQPNASALNNLGGTGDSCSAYGNRNFWKLFNDWFGATTTNSDANTLNFIRLDHYSGKVELIGYPSIGAYSYANKNVLVPYPATIPLNKGVVPMFRPNGDLSFVRLNDSSGKVVITTYNAASNFQQLSSVITVPYPAVPADGAVIPMFRPNGDLSFVRLNHSSGKVEVVTYAFNGYFQQLSSIIYAAYPAVPADGAVIPMFRPNGDLSFVRLNHSSGKVEVVTYAFNGYFQRMVQNTLTGYPSVTIDGAVVPRISP
jgi:hypothetical protein